MGTNALIFLVYIKLILAVDLSFFSYILTNIASERDNTNWRTNDYLKLPTSCQDLSNSAAKMFLLWKLILVRRFLITIISGEFLSLSCKEI